MKEQFGRRDFLKTSVAAAGLPTVSALWAVSAHSNSLAGGSPMKTAYDPAAKLDLKVSEVEFRRAVSGRMLMARARPTGCSRLWSTAGRWSCR